jgi:uncharacterized metal-binding protein
MPNGKTHNIITFVVAPVIAGVCYFITKDIKIILFLMSAYFFASFMFNGDLDTNSAPYNRWWVFKMIWIPYQLMFNHRSIFTHGLIIGTIIRLIYVGIIPFVIFYFCADINVIKNINIGLLVLLFIGLESGAMVHTISDKLF